MKNTKPLGRYQFWLVVGSQDLYGPQVLETVAARAAEMADVLDQSPHLPGQLIYKATVRSAQEVTALMREANYDSRCAGVIAWMHTFSPAKMWLSGLDLLQKPYLHLHTQYGRNIPNDQIDMDFMNLNQSAHGDREHGFMAARLRIPRKVVVGYWRDEPVAEQIGGWMRSAAAVAEGRELKVVRFGDNMRQVAVTEGDKIEAQRVLGWQVNTHPVGDLVAAMAEITEAQVDEQLAQYTARYQMATENTAAVRYQARAELGMRALMQAQGAMAFSNTFEDLHGMEQLPGLATQNMMYDGYGYGGEGDWKTAALTRVIKVMAAGLPGGTGFMEDYTYDLELGRELSLGAHMLEVCPSFAADKPRIEVHPLGIGNRQPPARLVFEGKAGPAVVATLSDMGGRLRLIVQDVEAVTPIYSMPNLPVARLMWRAMPDLLTGAHAWILAGGGHHTVFSYDATAQMLIDWAEMLGLECIHINAGTTIEGIKRDLFLADLAWKLR